MITLTFTIETSSTGLVDINLVPINNVLCDAQEAEAVEKFLNAVDHALMESGAKSSGPIEIESREIKQRRIK